MIHHHEISEHWGKEPLKSEGAGRRERSITIVHRDGQSGLSSHTPTNNTGGKRTAEQRLQNSEEWFLPKYSSPNWTINQIWRQIKTFSDMQDCKVFPSHAPRAKPPEAVLLGTRRHRTPQIGIRPGERWKGSLGGECWESPGGQLCPRCRRSQCGSKHCDHRETWWELPPLLSCYHHTNLKPRMKCPESDPRFSLSWSYFDHMLMKFWLISACPAPWCAVYVI